MFFSPPTTTISSHSGALQPPSQATTTSPVASSSVSLVMRASPVRNRRRSRYRHNNSPVSSSTASLVGILKSPAKHSTNAAPTVNIQSNPVADGRHDNMHVSPPSGRLRHYGPGTAVRNITTERCCQPEKLSSMSVSETNNLNDICFGCDGSCSDPACTSKKSTKRPNYSICDTCTVSAQTGQSKLTRMSNPPDVSVGEIEDSENGNTQSSNSPAKVMPELANRGQVSPQVLSSKLERLCSNGNNGEFPLKKGHSRTEISAGRVRNTSTV